MRIGHGYDVHRFGEGDHIILGGVKIDHDRGLIAHSDGDVVLHAVCDALLGALALGDIGEHFPDTDSEFKGADSRELLRHCVGLINQRQWLVANIDITVIAQAPKLSPFKQMMRENIANDLHTVVDCVNVKATTTEKLGFEGRKEGISCHAVVLLQPLKSKTDSD